MPMLEMFRCSELHEWTAGGARPDSCSSLASRLSGGGISHPHQQLLLLGFTFAAGSYLKLAALAT